MPTGKIAVSGASGFIGIKLCQVLRDNGYEICPMVRRRSNDVAAIFYDYHEGKIDLEKLSECNAVIHLAGKNIMAGLWTKKFRNEIYDSRVKSTRFIAHSMAKLEHGPKILLNASAIGIYGDRVDQKLDEESSPGHGFMPKLCVDWERGTLFAKTAGIRVANMRFGLVLDEEGGMLKKLIPIYKLGLGGPLGSGQQYMTYVTRDDLVSQIIFVLENQDISGPVNMVAYEPTTNEEFSEALAKALHKPAALRTPASLLKLLGDQGEIALASIRAYPKVLLDHGFKFREHQNIEEVLKDIF